MRMLRDVIAALCRESEPPPRVGRVDIDHLASEILDAILPVSSSHAKTKP